MMVDRPASPFSGHTWYLFDQVWRFPVTRVPGSAISNLDFSKYNVLILPDGRYPGSLGEPFRRAAQGLGSGRRDADPGEGGRGLGHGKIGRAAREQTGEEGGQDASPSRTRSRPRREKSRRPRPRPRASRSRTAKSRKKLPTPCLAHFLRASVYDDHFVTFGSPGEIYPLINTELILSPLKPTDGRNLVNFAGRDLLVSGFCWPQTLELMAGKPLVLYQSLGRGHVVAFADDPNYRAMTPVTQRFFLNAVFLGPGH